MAREMRCYSRATALELGAVVQGLLEEQGPRALQVVQGLPALAINILVQPLHPLPLLLLKEDLKLFLLLQDCPTFQGTLWLLLTHRVHPYALKVLFRLTAQ